MLANYADLHHRILSDALRSVLHYPLGSITIIVIMTRKVVQCSLDG